MKRLLFISIFILSAGILLGIYFCNSVITDFARGKLYADVKEIPYNRVGLLLGTSPKMAKGMDNPFYVYRIMAAVELIQSKKIKYLVISGDNGRQGYNEPDSMRKDLIKAGIDSGILFLDYAGFRTFDSIKRLKEIFGQDTVTMISQKFHNERAVYLAEKESISAIGFNARDVNGREGFKTEIREKLARVKVFLDEWFGIQPKYLGSKIEIPQ